MESLSSTAQNTFKKVESYVTLKLVLSLVVIYIVYRCFFAKEGFAEEPQKMLRSRILGGGTATPHELVEHDREITINPPYRNLDTRSIMAGSGFIPPKDLIPAWGNNYGLADDLDDGASGNMGLNYNLCSPSCCSAQYPTPHKLAKDPLVCGREDEFVPSNMTCQNSWQNGSCLCLTKPQAAFISARGGNA